MDDREAGIAALADPWLDDIIRCLEVGMGKWQDEHRIPGQIGAWQFKGADGPFHELTQSTLRRLKDYRAAHKVRDAIPAEPLERLAYMVVAALTNEDEIAHGEAWLYDGDNAGHGLGVCAYCDDKWPCRTQRGINRLLAALRVVPEAGLDVERLARALHDSYLRDPAMPRIYWTDLSQAERAAWKNHAKAVAREYAADTPSSDTPERPA